MTTGRILIKSFAAVLWLCTLSSTPSYAEGPRLARQLSFGKWGGQVVRYGDLDGDGETEVLAVQSQGQFISSLAAFSLQGRLLWSEGKPSRKRQRIAADLPVQIFDLDGDGSDEVIVVRDYKLQVLQGRNGKKLRETPVKGKDSIHIYYRGKRPIILVKDRYKTIWAFNESLEPVWSKKTNTGHIPLSFDFDHDGEDELLIGYELFNSRGAKLWHVDFPLHNDAADAGDMDGDGIYEIALSTSKTSTLLSQHGEILWSKAHGHSQHTAMGDYLADGLPDLQAAFLDRRARGTVYFYNKAGEEIGVIPRQGRATILSTIDGWTGKSGESYLLLFRREVGPPALFNAKGEKVLEFPFTPSNPPLREEAVSSPRAAKKKLAPTAYRPQYVQHFDAFGDGREEIFITDATELWVYENSDPLDTAVDTKERLPNKRIYNASFYAGMQ